MVGWKVCFVCTQEDESMKVVWSGQSSNDGDAFEERMRPLEWSARG